MAESEMRLQLVNNCGETAADPEAFRALIEQVVRDKHLPVGELSVIFVNDDYLKNLHARYLDDDTYTDVMTFNLGDGERIEAEIYVSYDRAVAQAGEFGVAVAEELARLIIHGLLHLEGHDDRTEEERRRMHRLENELLTRYWGHM